MREFVYSLLPPGMKYGNLLNVVANFQDLSSPVYTDIHNALKPHGLHSQQSCVIYTVILVHTKKFGKDGKMKKKENHDLS